MRGKLSDRSAICGREISMRPAGGTAIDLLRAFEIRAKMELISWKERAGEYQSQAHLRIADKVPGTRTGRPTKTAPVASAKKKH